MLVIRRIHSLFSSAINEVVHKSHIKELTALQHQAVESLQTGEGAFLHGPDGTGKTLALLISMMNHILQVKKEPGERKGGVLLTLNKQLTLQAYQFIRKIDTQNELNVRRGGPISHYSPVIDELAKPKDEQDEQMIGRKMEKNVAEGIDWPQTDLLITTPHSFQRILEHKMSNQQPIHPAVIAIDEADLLLTASLGKSIRNSYKILVDTASKKQLGPIKHLLAAPTLACLKSSKSSAITGLFSNLPVISHEISETSMRKIDVKSVLVEGQYMIEVQEKKIAILQKLLTQREGKRVIVFSKKDGIRKIKGMMDSKFNRVTHSYYADLASQKRAYVLFEFNDERSDSLVATELASRGLAFRPPIDTIISMDDTSAEDELLRMGRMNKEGGEYIIVSTQARIEALKQHLSEPQQHSLAHYYSGMSIEQINLSKRRQSE